MKDFLFSFLGLTVSMSIFIVLLLVLSGLMKKHLKATSRYIIWLMIAVRLVIPFGAIGMPSLFQLSFQVEETEIQQNNVSQGEGINPGNKNANVVDFEDLNNDDNVDFAPNTPIKDEDTAINIGSNKNEGNAPYISNPEYNTEEIEYKTFDFNSLILIIFTVWCVGAIGVFGVNIVKYNIFALKLKGTLNLPTDELYELYFTICKKRDLNNPPELFVSDYLTGPVMYGYFKKRIVLPSYVSKDSDERIASILAHELVHYSRGDLWAKLVVLISNSIHFFNPLVYVMAKRVNWEMELSCDEQVLKDYDEEKRIEYGKTLLSIANKNRCYSAGLTTQFDSKKSSIKKRITDILDSNSKRRGTIIVVCVLIICIFAGLFIGVSVKNNEKKDDDTDEMNPQGNNNIPQGIVLTKDERDFSSVESMFEDYSYVYKTYYELDLSRYAVLKEWDDGSLVAGKFGGTTMILKDERGLHNIPLTWFASEKYLLVEAEKTDLDSDGTEEYLLNFKDASHKYGQLYVIDYKNNEYLMYNHSLKDAVMEYEKQYSTKWNKETENIEIYKNDVLSEEVRLNGIVRDKDMEFREWSFSGINYHLRLDTFDLDVCQNGIFQVDLTAQPRFKSLKTIDAEINQYITVNIKYNAQGEFSVVDMSAGTNVYSVYSKFFNREYKSNNEKWKIYNDIEGNIVVTDGDQKTFRFGHDNFGSGIENGVYIQVALFEGYKAPELLVTSNEKYAFLIYDTWRFSHTDPKNRAALFFSLEDGHEIVLSGGYDVSVDLIFDRHKISDEIRKKYNYMNSTKQPSFYIYTQINELTDKHFEVEYILSSYDGNLYLKGYTLYDMRTGIKTSYFVRETVVK